MRFGAASPAPTASAPGLAPRRRSGSKLASLPTPPPRRQARPAPRSPRTASASPPAHTARRAPLLARSASQGEKTVVTFHEESLPDADEREARRAHYREALERIFSRAG